MTPAPKTDWSQTTTDPLISEPTPPAKLATLVQACRYPLQVAAMPYAGCARVFDGITEAERYLTLRLAPASVHARAALTITSDSTTATAAPSEIWTAVGGSSGANVIKVQDTGQTSGRTKAFAFDPPLSTLLVSSAGINDTPVAAVDRQLELTTDDSPVNEQANVKTTASFSICVTDRADLETL
jgi:hypothetical protein